MTQRLGSHRPEPRGKSGSSSLKTKKYPAFYPYQDFGDSRELKYSIRSLQNIKNWDGNVYIAGSKCSWFNSAIHFLSVEKTDKTKFFDSSHKIATAIRSRFIKGDFILMNDDFFAIRPTEVKHFMAGEKRISGSGEYRQASLTTHEIVARYNVKIPLDFELHVPMLANAGKWLEIYDSLTDLEKQYASMRTLYGNLALAEEVKTKIPDNKVSSLKNLLPECDFFSTTRFIDEITELYPEKSKYER